MVSIKGTPRPARRGAGRDRRHARRAGGAPAPDGIPFAIVAHTPNTRCTTHKTTIH